MRRRRREDINCETREKERLEDGKAGGEEYERIFAKGKGETRKGEERRILSEKRKARVYQYGVSYVIWS